MKKILFLIMMLISFNCQAFTKIEGNRIVLLTAIEREQLDETIYEELTHQRAINVCQLLNKKLVSYTYEEIDCDYCNDKYPNLVIVKDGTLRTPSYDEIENHYHNGGVTVAIISLGFLPIIIDYKTRLVKDIICEDKVEYTVE